MDYTLFIYTRIPDQTFCLPSFGNSIHFAVSEDGHSFIPLNQNRGILYARGEVSPMNQIVEKGLADPEVVVLSDGSYAILARRTGAGGQTEEGYGEERLLWLTEDFITFEECGLVDPKQHHRLSGMNTLDRTGQIPYPLPGVAAGCRIRISEAVYERLIQVYIPVHNTFMDVPDEICVSSREELNELSFTAHYSDGSTARKRYDAVDVSDIDFEKPGTYHVTATVRQKPYSFPLAVGFADPVVFLWEGSYYYISTNDNTDDVGFWVRKAECVPDLFAPDTEQHLILDKDPGRKLIQTFWAPEFHVIGGRVYVLFAVSGDTFDPQCHMMRLKKNGSITKAEDWEDPVRVRKRDGAFLAEAGITLDMTYFENNGKSYVVWSYRENCMAEGDTGSMLYIAQTDPGQPWMLLSDPVLLSRPLYGWENVDGTINNEGPYPLLTKDRVYIAYSGGSACNWTYTVGLLRAGRDADLLDPEQWVKSTCPALSSVDLDGFYGPGHNSFFLDKEGDTYIAYHGEGAPYDSPRSTALHRVHFNQCGEPALNVCYDRDIKEEYRILDLKVVVG